MTLVEVKHIADLARIELSDKETEKYQKQLGDVLNYFEKLKQVDTDGVETADGGTRELYNIWRQDEKLEAGGGKLEKKELIKMAPEVENGLVKVKKIL